MIGDKKGCYNMLYDVSGAYDRITHEQIKRGMEILHLPEHIQNYIMNKLTEGGDVHHQDRTREHGTVRGEEDAHKAVP
jgi:hypothetical protein